MGQLGNFITCAMKDNLLQLFLISLGLVIISAKEKCCPNVLLDVDDPESDVHILQGARLGFYSQIGEYGDRPQYKQLDRNNFIFYSETESMWITAPDHVGSTSTGITSNSTADCVESISDWQYYNGTQWHLNRNLSTKCAKIEDICCKTIHMSSPASNSTADNSSSMIYAEEARKTLGRYTAVGTSNGRYIYQHDGMDRYLQFDESNLNWLIVHEVGKKSGFIYHSGGSVCPENSGARWHVASYDKEKNATSWEHDPEFEVSCVNQKTPEHPSFGVSKSDETTPTTLTTLTTSEKKSSSTKDPPKKTTMKKVKETTTTIVTTTSDTDLARITQNVSITGSSTLEPTSEMTPANPESQSTPVANPLISKTEDSGSSVTPIVVSLLFLLVFTVGAIFLVRRFRKSWSSGSHGRQLVMETLGLYRDI